MLFLYKDSTFQIKFDVIENFETSFYRRDLRVTLHCSNEAVLRKIVFIIIDSIIIFRIDICVAQFLNIELITSRNTVYDLKIN